MKSPAILLLLAALLVNLGFSVYLLATRKESGPAVQGSAPASKSGPEEVHRLALSLSGIRAELRELQQTLTSGQ